MKDLLSTKVSVNILRCNSIGQFTAAAGYDNRVAHYCAIKKTFIDKIIFEIDRKSKNEFRVIVFIRHFYCIRWIYSGSHGIARDIYGVTYFLSEFFILPY